MKLQEQMFMLMEKWQKSDLVKHEFLKGTGISSSKFDYWHKKYNESKVNTVKNTDFQELRISQKPVQQQLTKIIELTTQSGLTVKVFEKC